MERIGGFYVMIMRMDRARQCRKNHRLHKIPTNLVDVKYLAEFLGISVNALYLRMHFGTFLLSTKINGKLYFDLNEALAFFKDAQEEEAFCYLVRDEIRTCIDLGKLTRKDIGAALEAKNETVVGGGVYSRPIGYERAQLLLSYMRKKAIIVDIDTARSFVEQKNERLSYCNDMWNRLITLVDENKITSRWIGDSLGGENSAHVGKAIYKFSPSYRIAKLLHLKLLQGNFL